MRSSFIRCLPVCALVLAATPALAQQFDLPAPSPGASVKQTVGFTDISVDYSSPGVRGRKIWGGVVKWDEVWRAGDPPVPADAGSPGASSTS